MNESKDWIEKVKEFPTFIRAAITLLSLIIGFIILFRDNVYLCIVISAASILIAIFCLAFYLLFAKSTPLILGGKGVYRYARFRPWAVIYIVLFFIVIVLTLTNRQSLTFIKMAFSRTATTTLAQTSTSTPAVTETPPSPKMVFIPEGYFLMGNGAQADTRPERQVYLDSYWIDTYEVTNEEYLQFVLEDNHQPPEHWRDGTYRSGKELYPVIGVSWNDANAYCRNFMGKRLPTEAEWEKAARGTNGRIWPWTGAWDSGKANTLEGGAGNVRPVGSYPQGNSAYGVADMAGNAWEWVNDWYEEDYYNNPNANRNPPGPPGPPFNPYKVLRGGSWVEGKEMATTYFRLGIYPPEYPFRTGEVLEEPYAMTGFRCACNDCVG